MDILKESMPMISLADVGLAYMDHDGTVLMYELQPELAEQQQNLEDSVASLDEFTLSQAFQTQEAQEEEFKFHPVKIDDEDEEVDVEGVDKLPFELEADGGPEDCVEQVTMFKCRACVFTAPEKNSIIQHYAENHIMAQSAPAEVETVATNAAEAVIDEEERSSAIPSDESMERLLYLCSKCNGAFVSIELCRQHMIQEHKCISGKGKAVVNTNVALPEVAATQTEWFNLAEQGTVSSADQGAKTVSTTERKENEVKRPRREAKEAREGERKLKCPIRCCPFKFSNAACLEIHRSCHIKGHTNVKEFQCVHCQEKFPRWRQCSAHLWRTHQVDVDMLACPVCQCYKAATAVKLEIHMRIHGDERPFRCSRCSKGFKQAAQLKNHTAVHLDKRAVGTAANVPRWYMEQRCPLCDKIYSDTKCLKKHIKAVHNKLRPYVCSVCGHAAACRAMLVLHLRQHTGEKPHACPHCDYRTGDHNCLRRHMMRHTGERQYHCPHCSYTSIQASSFKAHLRNRHPGQAGAFSCDSCRFQTVSNEAFQQHQSDHKKGLIASSKATNVEGNDKEEYFPGNVAAAHFMFHYLGSVLKEPGQRAIHCANVMDSCTSPDGTTQSITIQIPTQETSPPDLDDDESAHCFLELKGTDEEISIDTGGITIPAEPAVVDMA